MGQQHYGPQFQGQGGQQQQPFFQYSNCTGKRKALLIGINYAGTSSALAGCINDANNVKNFLIRQFHYRDEDIVLLTDDARNQAQMPTRANILRAMQWLVSGAQPNDSLFFHYSGHGGQTEDLDGDEDDGYDESESTVSLSHRSQSPLTSQPCLPSGQPSTPATSSRPPPATSLMTRCIAF